MLDVEFCALCFRRQFCGFSELDWAFGPGGPGGAGRELWQGAGRPKDLRSRELSRFVFESGTGFGAWMKRDLRLTLTESRPAGSV